MTRFGEPTARSGNVAEAAHAAGVSRTYAKKHCRPQAAAHEWSPSVLR